MAESHNSSEEVVTMCDVLQEEQKLEDDANAVLGGSDDTNCSYNDGYVPRQALYACKTCCKNGEKAGICLACCYKCHDDHEVVELYTKRNFRCDCGNSIFKDKSCLLTPYKDSVNEKNTYNQNFQGLYCSCSRPYPDLEDNVPDEMIQCILCEDWYHGRHLKTKVPLDYFEMICESCMQSHSFLYSYFSSHNPIVDVDDSMKVSHCDSNGEVKSETTSATNGISSSHSADSTSDHLNIKTENLDGAVKKELDDSAQVSSSTLNETENPKASSSLKHEKSFTNGSNSSSASNSLLTKSKEDVCILKQLQDKTVVNKGATFWPENWRKELCSCSMCVDMYFKLNCEFLLNPDDTVHAYEEKGKGKGESQYDRGMSALGQMDRVKQMEAVRAYTSMKHDLKEYLKTFADNKRTVCESDIKDFFEQMSKKKKLNDGVPHFCR